MDLHNSALTVGVAMAAGVGAQIVARHLAIPGIVLLLVAGVLLGPDGAALVHPEVLGAALHALVGFAVAVILFAGAMNLDLRRLSEERVVIRRLVTWGAFITGGGAALSVRALLGWEWGIAALFGSLVIVTGPTVVTPLVRRLRLREPLGTILEAEGVLIDPVGAIFAVVTLEVVHAGANPFVSTFQTAAAALSAGALAGFAAGALIVLLLRPRWLVPAGLENILVLSIVMFTFQLSESLRSESGLAAVVVAGLVVGNVHTRVARELLEFKEQLTVFMIGVLFVLLAADVRMSEVRALGWAGLTTVAALIVVVRPLQAGLCTVGSGLGWRERVFVASMAPRGIVAAAVASLFSQYLIERESAGGPALRALVFLVIAGTVLAYSVAGEVIARVLGLRQPTGRGYAFLGCNALSIALARGLELDGDEVVFVDSNMERVLDGRSRGYPVLHGQGLHPEVIEALEPGTRTGCIALSPNEEVNLLFARGVREETRVPRLYIALRRDSGGIAAETVRGADASLLFGRPCDLEQWSGGLEDGTVNVEVRLRTDRPAPSEQAASLDQEPSLLILAVRRRGRRVPYDEAALLESAAEIVVAIDGHRRAAAEAALAARGFGASATAPALAS
jgi:NhaP-type Na+/H+ or K+/H+ antiporter/Trk K+ transport system NAD-binding subunit